jgi:hypothetical protein
MSPHPDRPRRQPHSRLLGVATAAPLILLAACQEGAPAPSQGRLRGPCPTERAAGLFAVEMGDRFTSVSGRVLASPAPRTPPEQVAELGGCRLLRAVNPFCDPACSGGQLCVSDGRCVDAPRGLGLGTVTVTGLKKDVAMEPRLPSNEYFDVTLPHPGYEPGATIELSTSGGETPAFRLQAVGVAPLTLVTRDLTLDADKDVDVTWTGAAGARQVQLRIDVDQHGSSPVAIECEFEDVGSAILDKTLIAKLLAFGVSGFPTGTVTRRADDSLEAGPGCVGLAVASAARAPLNVVGHIPCNVSQPCPEGKTCDLRRETCQ